MDIHKSTQFIAMLYLKTIKVLRQHKRAFHSLTREIFLFLLLNRSKAENKHKQKPERTIENVKK